MHELKFKPQVKSERDMRGWGGEAAEVSLSLILLSLGHLEYNYCIDYLHFFALYAVIIYK